MCLMLGKTISSTGKTSDVRYITLSYEGSHEDIQETPVPRLACVFRLLLKDCHRHSLLRRLPVHSEARVRQRGHTRLAGVGSLGSGRGHRLRLTHTLCGLWRCGWLLARVSPTMIMSVHGRAIGVCSHVSVSQL